MITIEANGSKWAGEAPDDLETLFERLATHKLDRRFSPFSQLVADHLPWHVADRSPYTEQVRFYGNFEDVSAVFRIVTDEPALCARLFAAIRDNLAR